MTDRSERAGRAGLATLVVALGAVGLAACGDEGGVLIEITRGPRVPAAIDRLAIFAGTDVVVGGGFADRAPDRDLELGGRDLLTDPYRLLLEPTPASADRRLMVAAVAYVGEQPVGFGALPDPVVFVSDKVARWPLMVRAALPDGLVDDGSCLSWFEADGTRVVVGRAPDLDCDGFAADDCDDLDPAISPAGLDACDTGRDEDCDGAIDEDVDDDEDQFTTCTGGDCDDRTAAVNPGASETCDGLDNDCDGDCDGAFDGDGDLFTPCGSKLEDGGGCLADPALTDCDDGDPEVRPFATEACDGVDNDCSGACDDDPALDPDADLYTSCGSRFGMCGVDEGAVDCAPEDGAIGPGAAEQCNGIDDDCDGGGIENAPCFGTLEDACYAGVRPCDDLATGDFTGPCVVDGEAADQVDPAMCAAYDACETAAAVDPYACALDASGDALVCHVGHLALGGAQCPANTAALPGDAGADCSWSVIGGVDQGDYRVGLLAPGGDGGLQPTGVCAARLIVELHDVPASPTVVALERTEGLVTEIVRIELSARASAACSPPPGLSCEPAP